MAVSVAPADVLSTLKNSTQHVSELIASGDSMAATTLIASSAELLNQNIDSFVGLSAARQIRSDLLALSWNATETLRATAETVNLRAATLELIFGVPAQVDGVTQASGVAFAAHIASNATQLPASARQSLVNAFSSIIDAGYLSATVPGRRLSADTPAAVDVISAVLQQIHLLTVQDVAPGEDAVTTSAYLLSLSSSEASCTDDTCPRVEASPPVVGPGADALFVLDSATLSEITASSPCLGQKSEVGLMVVQWSLNPYANDRPELTTRDNVTSLTLTACSEALAVQNLSAPIHVFLPLSDGAKARRRSSDARPARVVSMACEIGGYLEVQCESGHVYNASCPGGDATWNVTCPIVLVSPTCLWFDTAAGRWSDDGCAVVNATTASSDRVACDCGHLTSFVASLDIEFGAGVSVVRSSAHSDEQDFVRAGSVLFIVLAVYVVSFLLLVKDRARLRRAREKHYCACWTSNEYQASVEWIRAAVDDDPLALDGQEHTHSSRDSAAEQAKKLGEQHEAAKEQLRHLVAPSLALHLRDFWDAVKREHVIVALLYPDHASFERAPSILMRLISLLFGSVLKYTIVKSASYGDLRSALTQGPYAIFTQLRIKLVQTCVVLLLVTPFRNMLVAALRLFEDKHRVHEMCEEKLVLDGVARTLPAHDAAAVDLRVAIFSTQAVIRVAHERVRASVRTRHFFRAEAGGKKMCKSHTEEALGVIADAREFVHRLRDVLKRQKLLIRQQKRSGYKDLFGKMLPCGAAARGGRGESRERGESRAQTISEFVESQPHSLMTKAEQMHVILASIPSAVVQRRTLQLKFIAAIHGLPLAQRLAARKLFRWRPTRTPAIPRSDKRGRILPPEREPGLPIVELMYSIVSLLFIMCATAYIVFFFLDQKSQNAVDANLAAAFEVVICYVDDLLLIIPAILFIEHVVVPQLAKRVLRPAVDSQREMLDDQRLARRIPVTVALRLRSLAQRARARRPCGSGAWPESIITSLGEEPSAVEENPIIRDSSKAPQRQLELASRTSRMHRSSLSSNARDQRPAARGDGDRDTKLGDDDKDDLVGSERAVSTRRQPTMRRRHHATLGDDEDDAVGSERAISVRRQATTRRRHTTLGDDEPADVCAVLPRGWCESVDQASGQLYYFNESTGESQWDAPAVEGAGGAEEEGYDPAAAPALPLGWVLLKDPDSGHAYFHHPATGESRWDAPAAGAADPDGEGRGTSVL